MICKCFWIQDCNPSDRDDDDDANVEPLKDIENIINEMQ